ncbi:MAG: hypothetical protein IH991_00920 [Planctomycetes bacterium]|nr:hypothetical protein [Planctomycetota bacterium]
MLAITMCLCASFDAAQLCFADDPNAAPPPEAIRRYINDNEWQTGDASELPINTPLKRIATTPIPSQEFEITVFEISLSALLLSVFAGLGAVVACLLFVRKIKRRNASRISSGSKIEMQ